MAAHLHRYSSELKSMEDTIAAVAEFHRSLVDIKDGIPYETSQRVQTELLQLLSQFKAIKDFEEELEKKIQTSLALVSY